MDKRVNRWWVMLALVALATLAMGPAAVASQESAVEKPKVPSENPAQVSKAETSAKDANEDDESADADEKAVVHPSFNTIEDILAWNGAVASLWTAGSKTAPSESAPEILWRETRPDSVR